MTTASRCDASTKPRPREPVVTCTSPGAMSSVRGSSVAATSCSPSTSCTRRARPAPSVTTTTRQPSATHVRSWPTAASVSPRNGSTSVVPRLTSSMTSRSPGAPGPARSASSWSLAKPVSDHHGRSIDRACSRTWAMVQNEAVPSRLCRSTGTALPAAAPTQLASRNSALVATRSWARDRIRSGSTSTTSDRGGSRSSTDSMPPVSPASCSSAGARDSMPSTAMPSATLASMSPTPGSSAASRRARSRTASVSSSSRHGGAHRPCWASSRLRWSATLNHRTSSTVSPQNSTRSGCSSVGGKTSRMPPRTANSPRRSTRSVRE